MTRRSARHNQHVGKIKALLLTGSVMATLAGTRLLALQDPVTTDISSSTTESVQVVVPAGNSSSIALPPTSRATRLELRPIPQAVQPRLNPVAQTQSSR